MTELVPREPTMMPVVASPNEIIVNAKAQSEALMDVVEAKKLYATIGRGNSAKKYLEYEAWQLIGAFNSAYANTEYVRPIYESPASAIAGEIDNIFDPENEGGAEGSAARREVLAYEAKVNIVKHGEVLASAVMVCGMDSFPTRGRSGIDRDRAAMSAAQTWAASKAFRMVYSYVAVLSGYEPTPAAEMQAGSVAVTAVEDRGTPDMPERPTTRDEIAAEAAAVIAGPFEAFKKGAKELGYDTVEKIEGATGRTLDELEAMGVDELRVKFRELRSMAGESSE